jgi:hypothetical protein
MSVIACLQQLPKFLGILVQPAEAYPENAWIKGCIMNKQALPQVAAGLFLLWLVLLLPWLLLAPMSGMAFDAGPKVAVYVCVWSIWTYPISVALVWKYRHDVPTIAFLPCVNIATWVIAGLSV